MRPSPLSQGVKSKMKISNHTIDELTQMLKNTDAKLYPHKEIELCNEIERRKAEAGSYLNPVDEAIVLEVQERITQQRQEYGVPLSIAILASFSISIYFYTESTGSIQNIISIASIVIISGIFALLCFYIPYKAIILRIGRVLFSMSFAWYYWIGGGDEIILIMAKIGIGIGMMMLIFALLHYFTGIPKFW